MFLRRLQVDVFLLNMTSLGTLQRLRIDHDGIGHGAGWHLDKVTVREHHDHTDASKESKEYVFPCNRWLDDHEDDGRTERELFIAGNKKSLVAPSLCAFSLIGAFR